MGSTVDRKGDFTLNTREMQGSGDSEGDGELMFNVTVGEVRQGFLGEAA